MGQRTEKIKEIICQSFPGLVKDPQFKITSPDTPNYNCIAWAYNIDNRWMWPNTGTYTFLDGIHFWPSADVIDCNVKNFIEAFKLKGYEICSDGEFEVGYRKIALYVFPNKDECTHASRQLANGFWTSKLGPFNDIQHSTPESIEGLEYGKVFCYMKRVF